MKVVDIVDKRITQQRVKIDTILYEMYAN